MRIAGLTPFVDLPEQLASRTDDDGASLTRQREIRKRRKIEYYDPSSMSSNPSPLSRLAKGGKIGFQRAVRSLIKKRKVKRSANLPSVPPSNDRNQMLCADEVRTNKSLLIGYTIMRHFPGHGGAKGRITAYNPTRDSYELIYEVDGYKEELPFGEVMKLMPKGWEREQAIADLKALRTVFFAVVAEAEKSPILRRIRRYLLNRKAILMPKRIHQIFSRIGSQRLTKSLISSIK